WRAEKDAFCDTIENLASARLRADIQAGVVSVDHALEGAALYGHDPNAHFKEWLLEERSCDGSNRRVSKVDYGGEATEWALTTGKGFLAPTSLCENQAVLCQQVCYDLSVEPKPQVG